jgi:hypothetical protein
MNVKSKAYQEHAIFSKLEKYIEFYESFSDSIMCFVTTGVRSATNIDTYVYTSMSGTLESISLILKNGRINDAYSLLRKFHDSVIMNVYTTLYIEDNLDIENFVVQKIENWLSSTQNDSMPDFRGMTNYIKDSKRIQDLYTLINIDSRYKEIRERCTDNMHYNFYWNVMLNDNKIRNEHRGKYLDQLSADIEQLIIMHLSYIFYSNEKYMASSDYVDYLDCGQTPPENSQYWVSTNVQEIFDDLIKRHRPDIAKLIKDKTYMELT